MLGMLDFINGQNFSNFTIFAMGISPYITSSIIMQLLTIAIPALERLQKEGEEGRKKIAEITRVVTIALGCIMPSASSWASAPAPWPEARTPTSWTTRWSS